MNAIRNPLLILFDSELLGFCELKVGWENLRWSLRRNNVERLHNGTDHDLLKWMIHWENMYMAAQQVFNAWKEDKKFDEGETFARVDLFSTLDYLEQLPLVVLGPERENKFSEELVTSLRKHRAERVKSRWGTRQQARTLQEGVDLHLTESDSGEISKDDEPISLSVDTRSIDSIATSIVSLSDGRSIASWDPAFTYVVGDQKKATQDEGIKAKARRIEQQMRDVRDPLLILNDCGLMDFCDLTRAWNPLKDSNVEFILQYEGRALEQWKRDWRHLHIMTQGWFKRWLGHKYFDEGGIFAGVDLIRLSDDLEKLPLSILGEGWEKKFDKEFEDALQQHRLQREKARGKTPQELRTVRKERERNEREMAEQLSNSGAGFSSMKLSSFATVATRDMTADDPITLPASSRETASSRVTRFKRYLHPNDALR